MISQSGDIIEFIHYVKNYTRKEMIEIADNEANYADKNKLFDYGRDLGCILYFLRNNTLPPHKNDLYWMQYKPIFQELVNKGEVLPPNIMSLIK